MLSIAAGRDRLRLRLSDFGSFDDCSSCSDCKLSQLRSPTMNS